MGAEAAGGEALLKVIGSEWVGGEQVNLAQGRGPFYKSSSHTHGATNTHGVKCHKLRPGPKSQPSQNIADSAVECTLHLNRGFGPLCSQLSPKNLAQCLAYSGCSIIFAEYIKANMALNKLLILSRPISWSVNGDSDTYMAEA